MTGVGLYAAAQVLDRAYYLSKDFGIALWGVRAHRDDFWEEVFEFAGAAILLAVLNSFLRRPLIPGSLAEAEADVRRQERASKDLTHE